ncbi:MAG: hypothetical protein GTO67_11620 [Gammaproteobacteria bacterium]|nr:hypothetical protein [Gammaproteobacteria bacterium]NIM74818.1 hypothetical protein [Gammaproteobacteria bacterium]NIN39249.1 hypothetical protein [Gammaproteobacteria bacterium]NIO26735.1 hypothetical protein [Gammaproteobacteria bacterium]NIO67291.1 hypothetical protein [Gammaproteobacteria bacterium]
MSRRVFFLAGGRMAVYQWSGGTLLEPLWFAADEDGLTEFSLYLDHAPKDPVYLLVDVVEEEFREETIPHVIGGDRRALIRTRLNRLFRDPTYSYAAMQGREAEGRRDDRVLFTALIRPDLLSPWVGQIAKHKVPLAGIYSLPIVSETLIKRLPVEADHALLVTLQSTGGLRQTFFHQKRVKLSRLAIMPPGGAPGHASYVLGEIEKIRRYLNSLRQLPHDSPLDVYIVASRGLLTDVSRQSPDSLTTRHHLLDVADVAQMVGMKGTYGSDYSDRIFAHLLAKKRLPNQYAPASQTRHNTMYRARLGLIAASIALVVAALFVSGANVIDAFNAIGETASAKQRTEFYNERVEIFKRRMPSIPAEPRDIKAAVEMAQTLRNYKTTPLAMAMTLSRSLVDFDTLKVDAIEWLASTDPAAQIGGRRDRSNGSRPGNQALAASTEPVRHYQIADIKGRVEPFDGNYRQAIEKVKQFQAALLALPQVEAVNVVELPLDTSSDKVLQGDLRQGNPEARFKLHVVIGERVDEAG